MTPLELAYKVESAVGGGARTPAEISAAVGVSWGDTRMVVAVEALRRADRLAFTGGGYTLAGAR